MTQPANCAELKKHSHRAARPKLTTLLYTLSIAWQLSPRVRQLWLLHCAFQKSALTARALKQRTLYLCATMHHVDLILLLWLVAQWPWRKPESKTLPIILVTKLTLVGMTHYSLFRCSQHALLKNNAELQAARGLLVCHRSSPRPAPI